MIVDPYLLAAITDPQAWAALVAQYEDDDYDPTQPHEYRCQACDVHGKGTRCWNCDKQDTLVRSTVRVVNPAHAPLYDTEDAA